MESQWYEKKQFRPSFHELLEFSILLHSSIIAAVLNNIRYQIIIS